MSKEELFKKYQEILLKTNDGADDYVVALCQISNLINDYAEEKSQQICDLEAKLKALQNGIIDDETLNMLVKEHKLYKDLEAKLAESEKKAYSRGHSQRDIANEIKLNALREDVANKEKRIVELNQQLAITKKALELACETIKQMCGRPLWIGGNIPSPEPKDSEYFKDIAKEILENE